MLHTNVDGVLRITRLALPHIRDEGPHRLHGLDRRPAGVPERRLVHRLEVRRARLLATRCARTCWAGRSGSRPSTPASSRPSSPSSASRATRSKADAVYEGVDPVTPDEVADCVMFALTRPPHVNLDEIVIKAIAQSSGARVVRRDT